MLLWVRLADEVVNALEVEEDVVHCLRSHGVWCVLFGVYSEEDHVANVSSEIRGEGVCDLVVAEEYVSRLCDDLLWHGFEWVVLYDRSIDLSGLECCYGASSSAEHALNAEVRARPECDVSSHFLRDVVQEHAYEQ